MKRRELLAGIGGALGVGLAGCQAAIGSGCDLENVGTTWTVNHVYSDTRVGSTSGVGDGEITVQWVVQNRSDCDVTTAQADVRVHTPGGETIATGGIGIDTIPPGIEAQGEVALQVGDALDDHGQRRWYEVVSVDATVQF